MMKATVTKSTLSWSRDYTFSEQQVEHPWFARLLRIPYKIINGCAEPSPMLVRYRLLETPIGSLNLHHFLRGDEDRDLHDHPFAFVTLVLWGGYIEQLPVVDAPQSHPYRYAKRRPGTLLFRKASFTHRVDLSGADAWTLIAMSKKQRDWGFFTKFGWQPFYKYHSIAGCAEANSVLVYENEPHLDSLTRAAMAMREPKSLTYVAEISSVPLGGDRRHANLSTRSSNGQHPQDLVPSPQTDTLERRNRSRRLGDLKTVDLFPAGSRRVEEAVLHDEIDALRLTIAERDLTIRKQQETLDIVKDYCTTELLDKVHTEPGLRAVYRKLMNAIGTAQSDAHAAETNS